MGGESETEDAGRDDDDVDDDDEDEQEDEEEEVGKTNGVADMVVSNDVADIPFSFLLLLANAAVVAVVVVVVSSRNCLVELVNRSLLSVLLCTATSAELIKQQLLAFVLRSTLSTLKFDLVQLRM